MHYFLMETFLSRNRYIRNIPPSIRWLWSKGGNFLFSFQLENEAYEKVIAASHQKYALCHFEELNCRSSLRNPFSVSFFLLLFLFIYWYLRWIKTNSILISPYTILRGHALIGMVCYTKPYLIMYTHLNIWEVF